MLYFVLFVALLLLCLVFRIAGLLRLSVPLLYVLLVPTVFSGWYYAHRMLAEGIWYAMLVLVALSWMVTIIRRVRG